MKYKKIRQLVLIGPINKTFFIDTPGYLYHYEPFGIDIFIHHRVMSQPNRSNYYLHWAWSASDISTGLSLLTRSFAHTRDAAVEMLHDRLRTVSLREYNEAIWNRLANSPPHKASWRFDNIKHFAVRVDHDS